ncbi:MAG: hypothetical protein CSB47_09165 [Proteobacteria bacterium]|nr:MAG: hypothetical protein CSB47_09165 [Pseudomonadota bacterium]
MKINNRLPRKFRYFAPVFCSIAVLSTQLQAGPTIQLNGDAARDGMADSGHLGYVGGNTRIGVSIDRDLQGQAEVSHIILEDDSSATSAEGWFGYQLKDDGANKKGFAGGGVKLNHQWVNDEADTVHKAFGAYDRNDNDQAKITVGYGQETEDLFWSGHVSKGMGDKITSGNVTNRAYDYGVGGEVGTFIDSTLTRVRAGLDYEFGTDYSDGEDRPSRAIVSAGVEQFFHDTPHSVSLDVSGYRNSGGHNRKDDDFNARLGYRYEFGGDGNYQSAQTTRRRRVEIPGTPASPGRAAVPAMPAATGASVGAAAVPAQPAIPPKYERRAVKVPGYEFVKTTMKLENETFFDLNSAKLTPSAKRNLDKITSQIREHGYLGVIRITGNTCGMGDPVYDQRLSERRADAVRNYLITQGFNPEHLIARGLGKGSPKYDRTDNDFKNRRVDLEYVTERRIKKKVDKIQYKNVLVQEGRPAIPAQPARSGRAAHSGRSTIPALPPTPGTPSRFVWKTEVVKSAPLWIKRALHNTIRHNRTVNTYSTQNHQKAVVDDSFTLASGSALIDVLGNDSGGLTLVRVGTPSNGTTTIEGNQIRYVPNTGFSGTDSFTYTARDGDGQEFTATVVVTVSTNQTNEAPKAVDDNASTPENTAITIDVIANDTDPDSDALVVEAVGTPTNGVVAIVNNKIVYTPNTDFSGTDHFTYTITDNNGHTATANVTVTVTAVNLPPIAQDDAASTNYETAITIPVSANDRDPEGGEVCVSSISVDPMNGWVNILETGNEIKYTPNNGFSGTDHFTYLACDSEGNTAPATVTVVVREKH